MPVHVRRHHRLPTIDEDFDQKFVDENAEVHAFSDWGAAWEYNEDMADQKFQNSFGLGAHFNFNTYNYRFEWAHHDGENFFIFEDHFTF